MLAFVRGDQPRPAEASKALEVLALLLRDHLGREDPIIYRTVLAAQGERHALAANRMASDLDVLREDWTSYLYRWDENHVLENWDGFVEDSLGMLTRIRHRVMLETTVLYSLAAFYAVIETND